MTVEAVASSQEPRAQQPGSTLASACIAPALVQKGLNAIAIEITGLPLEHPTHSPLLFRDRAAHCLLQTLARPLQAFKHLDRYIIDYI